MGVINSYFQLLFIYFQISYGLQLPKILLNGMFFDSCCKCISFPVLILFYGKLNAALNNCELELVMLVDIK